MKKNFFAFLVLLPICSFFSGCSNKVSGKSYFVSDESFVKFNNDKNFELIDSGEKISGTYELNDSSVILIFSEKEKLSGTFLENDTVIEFENSMKFSLKK